MEMKEQILSNYWKTTKRKRIKVILIGLRKAKKLNNLI